MAKAKAVNINVGSANIVMMGVVSLLAVAVLWLLWSSRKQIQGAAVAASQSGSHVLHDAIGVTRDVNEDSSTVGSRSWFSQKIDQLGNVFDFGANDGPDLYEQGIYERTTDYGDLPVFSDEGQIILPPYGTTPYSNYDSYGGGA